MKINFFLVIHFTFNCGCLKPLFRKFFVFEKLEKKLIIIMIIIIMIREEEHYVLFCHCWQS